MQRNEKVAQEKISLGVQVAVDNKCALLIICSSRCKVWQQTYVLLKRCMSTIGDQVTGI
jgi:hypothetical protein